MIAADVHTLTGAYALHALDDEERDAFERHLRECAACGREVAEFEATAARLGLTGAVVPRPGFREEVLLRVAGVRQDAPGPLSIARSGRSGRRAHRPMRRALAACLVVAGALGGTAVWQHERAQDARDRAREVREDAGEPAAVLAAPDARTRTARLASGATGTVVVSERRDRAAFLVTGMAGPPPGKVYQLWFDAVGTMRDAGLMDPHPRSQAVVMKGSVDGASGLGITVVPVGGSHAPTSVPVALLPLPA
ncbi:anti-sigma factor domain-containing protein [Streptomyces sp. NPDC093060]|uniref:anti-sigma factor n=1 Tax=Streptomyces sp. NPDC093060 TaxID=3366019 RepID=UPI0038160361